MENKMEKEKEAQLEETRLWLSAVEDFEEKIVWMHEKIEKEKIEMIEKKEKIEKKKIEKEKEKIEKEKEKIEKENHLSEQEWRTKRYNAEWIHNHRQRRKEESENRKEMEAPPKKKKKVRHPLPFLNTPEGYVLNGRRRRPAS